MTEVIQCLGGEEVDGGDLPKHAPARTVGRKNEVLIVISNVFGAGVGRAVGEVCIVNFQELSGHRGGGGHNYVHEP